MTSMRYLAAILLLAFISGCAEQIDPAKVRQHQLEVQRMQTRVFHDYGENAITRGIIAALQDLDFVINKVETEQGLIIAKKFGTYPIEMTTKIQSISSNQISVHAIARYNLETLEDPVLYEQFFAIVKDYLPSGRQGGD
jgi:hypothetical protein